MVPNLTRSLTDGSLLRATPTDIRAAVLDDVVALCGAGTALFQTVELVGENAVLAHLQVGPVAEDGFRPVDLDGRPVWKLMDRGRFTDFHLNEFTVVDTLSLPPGSFGATAWGPHGVHSAATLIAERDGRIVGGIAVLRRRHQPRFADAELARLRDRSAVYVDWLARARERETEPGCHGLVALDPFGEPLDWDVVGGELVRDPAIVQLMSDMASGWSTPGRRDVVYRHGREIRILELCGPGPAAYCMLMSCTRPAPINDLVLLSPAKREIAELAAAGATAPEIARTVNRSSETVRTHLKQIYKQLGVASRIELASKFRELSWMRAPADS